MLSEEDRKTALGRLGLPDPAAEACEGEYVIAL